MKNVLSRVHYSDNLQKLVSLALYTVYHIYLHVHSSDQIYFFFFALVTNNCISDHYINHNYNPECKHYRIESLCVWMGAFVCVEVCL